MRHRRHGLSRPDASARAQDAQAHGRHPASSRPRQRWLPCRAGRRPRRSGGSRSSTSPTGDQPIANEDGTVVVVLQRRDLQPRRAARASSSAAGHRFRTASDTEVILHLYEEHGDALRRSPARHVRARALGRARGGGCCSRATASASSRCTTRATAEALVFGSEQKAILASGAVTPRARPAGHAPAPDLRPDGDAAHDRRRNRARLPPGACWRGACGSMTTSRYWDVTFPARDAYETRPDREWAEGCARSSPRASVSTCAATFRSARGSPAGSTRAPSRRSWRATAADPRQDVHDAHRGPRVRRAPRQAGAGRLPGSSASTVIASCAAARTSSCCPRRSGTPKARCSARSPRVSCASRRPAPST